MSDLISRQAAIEKISETIWDTAVANDVKTILKELPSAQPHDIARDIATIIENEKDMRVILKNAQPDAPDTNGGDTISRQAAIDALTALEEPAPTARHLSAIYDCEDAIKALPSAQPDARLKKIADLVDGTIDHFDRDDAMDLLYQIKEVLKNE